MSDTDPMPTKAEAKAQAKADQAAADSANVTANVGHDIGVTTDPPADPIEADKAKRADAMTTAAANGDLAGTAFWQRIQDAKFEIRNLGFSGVELLIDDLYAGIQRLESKHHGGG